MSKLSKLYNDFFYAWGDNNPKKEVLRYGKYITLEKWHEYDDYKNYRPRRQTAGGIIILSGLGLIGVSVKGIKSKYDKRKTDKENL
ncbi:hypothetical protein [Virgibacillus litoralis]|uniref:Uncharacterized protein n=1 Tax=Virgibacillus litoralis TaxID=578221 RepID=A0ABS4HIP2_9BACI|nr:hypothetical protein [Virgibacillus litoralis]MBP1950799.1 hypothetical protein [Virgibacillus litoralis]